MNPRYTDENTERLGQRLDQIRSRLGLIKGGWAKQFWTHTQNSLLKLWKIHTNLRTAQHKEFLQKPNYAIRYDWFETDTRFYNYVDDVASRVFAKFNREEYSVDLDAIPRMQRSLHG